ncbi:outer membrane protein assembly factor BamB family protein [Haloterrigena turkmenica]|nr:PQQ-binding-like beta-propeller repeat protein [Haloterrigena turkmenica]
MDRRSTPTPTRRRWLAACGGASVGIAGLSGCTGSDDSDGENGTSESDGDGEKPDENGTNGSHNGSIGESWPMARFSANNGMVTDEWSGPEGPLEERWTVEIEDGAVSGPVVGHGLVYVADETSTLHAIDHTTGDVEWTYEPELPPETPPNPQWEPTTPAVTDDAVYFLTETLYALEPKSGDVLWSIELGSLYSGDIRVYDGIVYVHNGGKLYAIDSNNQTIVWEDEASSTQDIAIGDDGMFYVVRRTNNGHDYEVMGIDISSKGTEWTYSPPGNVASGFGLLVRDGTVYLNEMEKLLMIDGVTGDVEILAEFEQTSELVPTTGRAPTIADGIAYSPAPSRYPAVQAVNLSTGKEPDIWDSSALKNGPTGIQPFVTDGTLYVWRDPGYVQLDAINTKTGKQQWTTHTTDHIDLIGGRIRGYAILSDTVVFTYNSGSGSTISTLEPE